MKIGLDFDGVIADGATLKSVVLRTEHGIKIEPDLCKRKHTLEKGLVSEWVYEEMLCRVYENPIMHARIKPLPGAVEAIHWLQSQGHALKIITARNPPAAKNVRPWLEQHGLKLDFVCVGRFGEKTEEARGCDAMVDDDFVHLHPLKGVVPHLYLFGPQPDMGVWTPDGVIRVRTWPYLLTRMFNLAVRRNPPKLEPA